MHHEMYSIDERQPLQIKAADKQPAIDAADIELGLLRLVRPGSVNASILRYVVHSPSAIHGPRDRYTVSKPLYPFRLLIGC